MMAFSSYQIEQLIDRLRRWLGGDYSPSESEPDPVRVTARGVALSREREAPAGSAGRGQAPSLARIADVAQHPAEVEREGERRAGSFMKPPYPDPPWPPHIPKLKRPPPQDSDPSHQVEGD